MIAQTLFNAFVYPGLAFVITLSLIYFGIVRKLNARMQNRIGPPLWQPFLDLLKLLHKEDITPEQAKIGYTFWPFIAMVSIITAALLTPIGGIVPLGNSDVIILIYFMIFGSLALYLSGFSSANPFSVVGAVRGIVQMIGYELPFVVSIIISIFASGNRLSPLAINNYQVAGNWIGLLFPFASIAYFISLLAKVEMPPFHSPDAHQEIVAGYYTEYTGTRLAMIHTTHMVKLFALISIGIAFFFGGAADMFTFLWKSLVILFFVVLSKATMARFRIDYVLRFCWIFGFLALFDLARVLLMM